MKTALTELIEFIKQMPAFQYEPVIHGIFNKATELLEKEKAQKMKFGAECMLSLTQPNSCFRPI